MRAEKFSAFFYIEWTNERFADLGLEITFFRSKMNIVLQKTKAFINFV